MYLWKSVEVGENRVGHANGKTSIALGNGSKGIAREHLIEEYDAAKNLCRAIARVRIRASRRRAFTCGSPVLHDGDYMEHAHESSRFGGGMFRRGLLTYYGWIKWIHGFTHFYDGMEYVSIQDKGVPSENGRCGYVNLCSVEVEYVVSLQVLNSERTTKMSNTPIWNPGRDLFNE